VPIRSRQVNSVKVGRALKVKKDTEDFEWLGWEEKKEAGGGESEIYLHELRRRRGIPRRATT